MVATQIEKLGRNDDDTKVILDLESTPCNGPLTSCNVTPSLFTIKYQGSDSSYCLGKVFSTSTFF